VENRAIDIAKALVRLSEVTIFELRGEWRRLHRMPPPMRLSRDLLIRGIIYQLQERAYGGLSVATTRKLEQARAREFARLFSMASPTVHLSNAGLTSKECRTTRRAPPQQIGIIFRVGRRSQGTSKNIRLRRDDRRLRSPRCRFNGRRPFIEAI
jgi:Protein of unknown function (DUF2924)